jgi:hypothetical protein
MSETKVRLTPLAQSAVVNSIFMLIRQHWLQSYGVLVTGSVPESPGLTPAFICACVGLNGCSVASIWYESLDVELLTVIGEGKVAFCAPVPDAGA